MAGKRNRKGERLATLLVPAPTPEETAARAQLRARASAALVEARRILPARLRRWLAAFELSARWHRGEELDLDAAAQHLGQDRAAAEVALGEIRAALAATGVRDSGGDNDPDR